MAVPISTNAATLVRRFQRRKTAVVRELAREALPIALVLVAESKKILQTEIYNVSIPLKPSVEARTGPNSQKRKRTTKGKDGLWMRTGNLKRRETAYARGPHAIMENRSNYALHRYRLGLSGHRAPKHTRSVQWQGEAVKRRIIWIRERRRRAILRALGG